MNLRHKIKMKESESFALTFANSYIFLEIIVKQFLKCFHR